MNEILTVQRLQTQMSNERNLYCSFWHVPSDSRVSQHVRKATKIATVREVKRWSFQTCSQVKIFFGLRWTGLILSIYHGSREFINDAKLLSQSYNSGKSILRKSFLEFQIELEQMSILLVLCWKLFSFWHFNCLLVCRRYSIKSNLAQWLVAVRTGRW